MWFCLVDLGPGQMMVDGVKLLKCPGHFALSGANTRPADTRDPTEEHLVSSHGTAHTRKHPAHPVCGLPAPLHPGGSEGTALPPGVGPAGFGLNTDAAPFLPETGPRCCPHRAARGLCPRDRQAGPELGPGTQSLSCQGLP